MEPKSKTLKALATAAAFSVLTFSSIGIAAITGHLQIAGSNLNPFSGSRVHRTQSLESILESIPVQVTHQGLTRHIGQAVTNGRPLDFRPGKPIPARKVECGSCGIIDSIQARDPGEDDAHPHAATARLVSFQGGMSGTDKSFIVTVRMGDGSMRTILESQRPAFSVGERVQLVNGTVIPLG